MTKITLKAPAKINLFLDIVGVREDGYHLINSVMQTIDLYDTVTVSTNDSENITISCDNELIPCDERNIAYKIAKHVFEEEKIKIGLHIDIKKRIPIETGMGGGSADGAAVLIALNEIFNLNLTDEKIINIGKKVGADIPFMTFGGTQFVEGIGEKLTSINNIEKCYFLIVKPIERISTKSAYQKIDDNAFMNSFDKSKILEAINKGDIKNIANAMNNIFEKVVSENILQIKDILKKCCAINSIMTGSGSAVFGVFENKSEINNAYKKLKHLYEQVFICEPIEHGPIILTCEEREAVI